MFFYIDRVDIQNYNKNCSITAEVISPMNVIYRTNKVVILVITIVLLFSSCSWREKKPKQEPLKKPAEAFLKYGETNESIVELYKVNDSVWVHTSYTEDNGSLIPSNGMLVVAGNSIVIVDTTWTEKQMESLDKLVKEAFNGSIKEAIITHAHQDKIGGVSFLAKKKISINCLNVVAETTKSNNLIVPDKVIKGDDASFEIDGTKFEIFYPGEGYSSDNTVVWIEKQNVLFAGCIVREYGSAAITNSSVEWKKSLEAIKNKFEDFYIVIPGHGEWGDTKLIDYTLELLDENVE